MKIGSKKIPALEDFLINIKVKLPLRAQINQILRMPRVEFERLKYKYMFSPKANKRLAPAFFLHEELHSRLEKHYFGDWKTFNLKSEDFESAIAFQQRIHDRTTNSKIHTEIQTILTSLKKKRFSANDVRKLITNYHKQCPEEFFTTALEAILHLKAKTELTPEIAKTLGFRTVQEAQSFVDSKLAKFSSRERKLTEQLKTLCSEHNPVFKKYLGEIEDNWDKVAPVLWKPFQK
jgi:hypothetical protein